MLSTNIREIFHVESFYWKHCGEQSFTEAATGGVLKNVTKFTEKYLCQSHFFYTKFKKLYSKETLALVFSCEFCGIFENIFFTEHPRTTASVFS